MRIKAVPLSWERNETTSPEGRATVDGRAHEHSGRRNRLRVVLLQPFARLERTLAFRAATEACVRRERR